MKKTILILSLIILVFISGYSQINYGGQPFSNSIKTLSQIVPTNILSKQDVRPYISEDVIRDQNKDQIWRFGINVPVNINIKQVSVIDDVNGGKLYRYRIYSEGAVSINFRFSEYKIPNGASLFIYNDDKTEVLGSFTSKNNKESGILGVSLIFSDAITLEYFEPNNVEFEGKLQIDRITHGYRSAYVYADKSFGSSGSCNNDVVCPVGQGWEDQINSVAMLVSGGSGFCSGSMVNNSSLDGTPYFLTANHCYSDPTDWVFWFNWHKTTCESSSGTGTASSHDDISGATLRARYAGSDFCLVELSIAPPSSYNVFYAGWDKIDMPSTSSCGIHHPSGDVKKISFDYDATTSSDYLGSGLPNSHWKISAWDDGTTEGGSSGSPLFNQNHKIIGQLHGGYASCTNIAQDVYGKFAMSWLGGGNASDQLKFWLGPCGYDLDTLDGFYPATHVLDAQIKNILAPIGTYCSVQTVNPKVIIKNLGTSNLTSCDVSYNIDGGSTITESWTGNLASSEVDTITFSAITLTSGVHSINFSLLSPNGGTDEVINSNYCTLTYDVSVDMGQSLPYTVDFEDTLFPPSNITLENPDGATTWERSTSAVGNGTSTAAAYINCLDYNSSGAEDIFITPKLNFTSLPDAKLTFNIAYRRYNSTYYEQFKVYISADCGNNWDIVYDKSGSNLATGSDQTSAFTPSTASDWRMDTVDLSTYVGSTVIIKFVNVNGYGNYIYLDDINISSSIISNNVNRIGQDGIDLFPNPTTNNLNIVIKNEQFNNSQILIYDVYGRIVKKETLGFRQKTLDIDISSLETGVYFVKVGDSVIKFVKE